MTLALHDWLTGFGDLPHTDSSRQSIGWEPAVVPADRHYGCP